jgi:hypothetical protein
LRRRLEQLRALAPWERRLVVRLVVLLPAVGASLRLLGFKRTRDLLERFSPPPAQQCLGETSLFENPNNIARLVRIAANHGPYRATCLRQSLTLWWMLSRRGIASELRIGCKKQGSNVSAHAWVEMRGRNLSDTARSSEEFKAFNDPLPLGRHGSETSMEPPSVRD